MRYILYIVAVVMIIVWAIGFFIYSIGAIIHLLLVLALVSFLVKTFSRNKRITEGGQMSAVEKQSLNQK